ncbi:hypothetical protein [Oceanibaculum indicum]|uniref:Uncharacterized protein n=1 Tax=Oceanibaculum indicum TaxID=526216 RepID=A0A420WGS2_9PROT|nr:hypothetical protein [Oceanibaculum indicum]RKQ70149.1 hypothetical protein BCL74_2089 [Oceanibaculum indicum]
MTGSSEKLPVAVPSAALQAVAATAAPSFPANEPMRSMAVRAWAVDVLLCHCGTQALSLGWLTRASGQIADFILTGEGPTDAALDWAHQKNPREASKPGVSRYGEACPSGAPQGNRTDKGEDQNCDAAAHRLPSPDQGEPAGHEAAAEAGEASASPAAPTPSQGPASPRAGLPAGSGCDEIPASTSSSVWPSGWESVPTDGYEAFWKYYALRDNPFPTGPGELNVQALDWADGWWRAHNEKQGAAAAAAGTGCPDPSSNGGYRAPSTTPTGGDDDEGDLAAEPQTELHSCAGAVAASPEKSPSVADGDALDPDPDPVPDTDGAAAPEPDAGVQAPATEFQDPDARRASDACTDAVAACLPASPRPRSSTTTRPPSRAISRTPGPTPSRAGTGHQAPPAYASAQRHDAARVAGKEGAAEEQAQIAEFLATKGARKIEPGGFEDLVLRTMKDAGHEVTKKRRGVRAHVDWYVDGKKVGDWSAIVSRANKLRRAKGMDPLSSAEAA